MDAIQALRFEDSEGKYIVRLHLEFFLFHLQNSLKNNTALNEHPISEKTSGEIHAKLQEF